MQTNSEEEKKTKGGEAESGALQGVSSAIAGWRENSVRNEEEEGRKRRLGRCNHATEQSVTARHVTPGR